MTLPHSYQSDGWAAQEKRLTNGMLLLVKDPVGALQASKSTPLVYQINPSTNEASLAYMELYLILSKLLLHFDFDLYETDDQSMQWFDRVLATNQSPLKVKVKSHSRHLT